MAKWGWLIMFVWLLLGPGQAVAAEPNRELKVNAAVPLSIEYEWIVQRQSAVDLPVVMTAGDQLIIEGVVRRQGGQPLVNNPVVLLMGRDEQVVATDQAITLSDGSYSLKLDSDQNWRGKYWLSVAVLTYGRPLWLINRQTIDWQAPSMGVPNRQVMWHLGAQIIGAWQGGNTQPLTDGYRATIKPNANIINDVERRVCSSFVAPLARGRDSPVTDRNFGVWQWAIG